MDYLFTGCYNKIEEGVVNEETDPADNNDCLN